MRGAVLRRRERGGEACVGPLGRSAVAPLSLRFWKKKRKVLFMPMIIMTPARNRICRRRGGRP